MFQFIDFTLLVSLISLVLFILAIVGVFSLASLPYIFLIIGLTLFIVWATVRITNSGICKKFCTTNDNVQV